MWVSLALPPEQISNLLNFVGNAEAVQNPRAVIVQSKLRREENRGTATREIKADGRAQILGRSLPAEAVGRSQTTVQLRAGRENLTAEKTGFPARDQAQRPAGAQRVAKFPRFAFVQRFFSDEIFGKVPAFDVAR